MTQPLPAEPILRAVDREAWKTWMHAAALHARTQHFRRRVDAAKRVVERALASGRRACVSWSAGKDSTCLAHLVTVELGAREVVLLSEKDDLDFPGEETYVRELAAAWSASLRLVRPDISPAAWIEAEARAGRLHAGDDLHSRAAGLSKACFYKVMEEADRIYEVVMLGLRAEESGIRADLRRRRGTLYRLRARNDQLRALPIADWTGYDVYAYALSRGIDLLHVYRCIGFLHRSAPWTLRKSWWLPGAGTARGQVAWLQRYYPSLYHRLLGWMPEASLFA